MSESCKIGELLPNPYNRDLDPKKVARIKAEIVRTKLVYPLVYSEVDHDGKPAKMLTDGHHRFEALKQLKYKEVPIVLSDERGLDTTAPKVTVKKYITSSNGKWTVHAESGKHLGTYGSREAAVHRLQQIEYFKHKKMTSGDVRVIGQDILKVNRTVIKSWFGEAARHAEAARGILSEFAEGAMKIIRRPISAIDTKFVGSHTSEEAVRGLMQAIETKKPIPPILVSKYGFLQDGRHRLEAYKRLGYTKVPTIVGHDPKVFAVRDISSGRNIPLELLEHKGQQYKAEAPIPVGPDTHMPLYHGTVKESTKSIEASGMLRAGTKVRVGTREELGLVWFSPKKEVARVFAEGRSVRGPVKPEEYGKVFEHWVPKDIKLLDRDAVLTAKQAEVIGRYNGIRQNYDPVKTGMTFDSAMGKVMQNSALKEGFMPKLLRELGYEGLRYHPTLFGQRSPVPQIGLIGDIKLAKPLAFHPSSSGGEGHLLRQTHSPSSVGSSNVGVDYPTVKLPTAEEVFGKWHTPVAHRRVEELQQAAERHFRKHGSEPIADVISVGIDDRVKQFQARYKVGPLLDQHTVHTGSYMTHGGIPLNSEDMVNSIAQLSRQHPVLPEFKQWVKIGVGKDIGAHDVAAFKDTLNSVRQARAIFPAHLQTRITNSIKAVEIISNKEMQLRMASNADGCFDAWEKKIFINGGSVFDRTPGVGEKLRLRDQATVVHEFAHAIDDSGTNRVLSVSPDFVKAYVSGLPITRYAQRNMTEAFAESLTAYVFVPRALYIGNPSVHHYMERLFTTGKVDWLAKNLQKAEAMDTKHKVVLDDFDGSIVEYIAALGAAQEAKKTASDDTLKINRALVKAHFKVA